MQKPLPLKEFWKYPVTSVTLALAVIVSLLYWSGQLNIELLAENLALRQGQLWRLITSLFPHGNILHLAFNLYWTWVFGTLVEKCFGSLKTFGIFVLFALLSSGIEYAFLDGGIGLSGLGYGLFGLLWILSKYDHRFTNVIDNNTIKLFIGWFFFCIWLTHAGYPIGNLAHASGALCGLLLGWAIITTKPRRQIITIFMGLLLVATCLGVTIARPWINLSHNRGVEEAYLGTQLLFANRNQEALSWLQEATRLQPKNSDTWYNLGIAYQRLKRSNEAHAAYHKAWEINPNNDNIQAATQQRDY